MADYTGFLANLTFVGEKLTAVPGEDRTVRNLLHLTLDGQGVELHQRPACMPSAEKLAGKLHTTNLIIRDLLPTDLSLAHEIARNVAELLSFITSSEVVAFGHSYGGSAEKRAFVGECRFFRPAIDVAQAPEATKSFLEQVYSRYKALRTKRQLNVAFDYYVIAQLSGFPTELKLVTSFVLMENLKSTFATERGYPFRRGYFRDPARAGQRNDRFIFEQLLTEMLTDVGMSSPVEPLVRLRNRLLHSGLTSLNPEAQWAIFEECQDLLREYLLRLLAFRGRYMTFSLKDAVV